ncbi:2-(1,2-epoxy-1,2-dihydrophenyl)acetyl-CoA isomerase PaaG [Gemmatimonas sp.]|jgi:2-(1,2-epoxy-1,2-dihydrophenyl)acetyl-CoA isomerase|uniref:2-(1,2-epoxy-1,2-dihydrophenyl)acetyl-CoA isomerase PaaG n=1 Tax=Gemmatimonas sp. TaxID=1962908 RepID=UPI0022BBFF5B|nr:2-(1,2-epoxy-1,2-dihydrophenyl)acetyl-CoA isomerase PaaG [Gemmatimonas sp.]MCZ8204939.1 2-(1,2-epoxy-1,2-dihydrophenyl)acetyl-CoA isomerase PaaG [Gemmatimonas sp.]
MTSPAPTLLVARANGVLTLTLNRPDVLNSFTRTMAAALQAALAEAAADDTVRAVVITGAGRGFCAGQDLAEALPRDGGPIPDIGEIVAECYNPIIRAIRTLEKPVLCAVNGIAAGAGANLAFACDLTIAADSASFVESFAKLGLIPDTSGTFFVPRLVGMQRATGMFFLAEKMPAAKAKDWGLIWDVVPAAELMATVTTLAEQLASQATRGFGLTKRALNASFANGLDAQLDVEAQAMHEAGRTADYAEGVRAFLEKRAPVYQGK